MSQVHTGSGRPNYFETRLQIKYMWMHNNCFRLNFLETASGLKFVLNTDIESSQAEIRELVCDHSEPCHLVINRQQSPDSKPLRVRVRWIRGQEPNVRAWGDDNQQPLQNKGLGCFSGSNTIPIIPQVDEYIKNSSIFKHTPAKTAS